MQRTAQNIRITLPLLLIWIFPLAFGGVLAHAQSPDGEMDLQQYIDELDSASRALNSAQPSQAQQLGLALSPEWTVRAGGAVMKIKTDWLAAALRSAANAPPAKAAQLRQAREHLAALRETAEDLSAQTVATTPRESRTRIDRILQAREFQTSGGPSWLDKLKSRISGWISRQWDRLFGQVGIPAQAGNVIAWILISGVFLLVALWSVRALLGAASRSEMDLGGAAAAGQDWRYWAAEARSAAECGDYRAAIHAAYWAAVARLEEKRLLPEDRSRTPREALRMVQRGDAAYPPLAQLTRRFELTWYGYRSATSADWNDAMQQLEILGCLPSSTPAIADL